MIKRNWLPPAAALCGESDVIDGKGGQVPQNRAVTSVIANTEVTAQSGAFAIGLNLRQTS